jgi:hypothetical protein
MASTVGVKGWRRVCGVSVDGKRSRGPLDSEKTQDRASLVVHGVPCDLSEEGMEAGIRVLKEVEGALAMT